MTIGTKGVEYEHKVVTAVNKRIGELKGITLAESTAGYGSFGADLDFTVFGKQLGVEVKLDRYAQMGGGSFNYDEDTEEFSVSGRTQLDPLLEAQYIKILKTKKTALTRLLNFARNNEISILASKISGLPLNVTETFWANRIRAGGYLVPLNAKVQAPMDFMYDHYEKKGVFYIQIGGAGLYYMKKNPLNLPIPKLVTNLNVELRLGRSGGRDQPLKIGKKTVNKKVIGANIRVQGRLSGCSPSPYSLDRPDDFIFLFGQLNKRSVATL